MVLSMMRTSMYDRLRPGCDLLHFRCPVRLDSDKAVISPNVSLSALVSHFDLGYVEALMPVAQLSTLVHGHTVCAVRPEDISVFAYENVPLESTDNPWSNSFRGRDAVTSVCCRKVC